MPLVLDHHILHYHSRPLPHREDQSPLQGQALHFDLPRPLQHQRRLPPNSNLFGRRKHLLLHLRKVQSNRRVNHNPRPKAKRNTRIGRLGRLPHLAPQQPQLLRKDIILISLPRRGTPRRSPPLRGLSCISSIVLDGREGEPGREGGEPHLGLRPQHLGVVLHHALEPRRFLEDRTGGICVLRVDKLAHHPMGLGEGGDVGREGEDQLVDVPRVGAMTCGGISDVSFGRDGRAKEGIELVVFHVNDHDLGLFLRRVGKARDGADGLFGHARDGERIDL